MSNLPLNKSKFCQTKFLLILTFLTFILTAQGLAQTLVPDNNFNAGVNDAPTNIYTSATQPDGKVLIGGIFHTVNGIQRPYLARLNSDGSNDETFNADGSGPSSSVYDIVILTDGKLLVGGTFTTYNGTAKSGLIRLNSDGSLDTTFNAGGAGVTGTVQTVVRQTDGKILISGSSITAYNGVTGYSILRINSDGTLDSTFTSPFTSSQFVEGIGIQTNGKIVISGVFTLSGSAYKNVARLNSNGSIDTSFSQIGTDGGVYALTIQTDGKIIIGGEFTTYQNNFRPKIARLTSDGALDSTFNSGSFDQSSVEYFAVQTDGKILVTGKFIDSFGQQFSLVRLNANGNFDSTFSVLPSNDTGYSIKLQTDGKIILTGFFSQIGAESRRGILRLNAGGSIDSAFNPKISNLGLIDAVAQQSNGKILVGGIFQNANGTAEFNIARFNRDGTLDAAFNPGTGSGANITNSSNLIYKIAVQTDGKILVGGTFSSFNGVFRPAIVRLNSDGSVDESFAPNIFDPAQMPFVSDIFIQADGKILIGGFGVNTIGQSFVGLVRLNANGSIDTTFNANGSGPNGTVRKIVRQSDGKFIISGSFTTYNGQFSRVRVARINADGTLDASFNPGVGANSTVWDVALQPDGKILIGGSFTSYNGVSRNRFARINTDGSLDTAFNVGSGADNTVYTISSQRGDKILIGGFFSNYNGMNASRLARINADGSLDNTFAPGFADNLLYNVRDILTQFDGKVLIGGVFDFYKNTTHNSLLRLTLATSQSVGFDFDGDGRADVSVFRPDGGNWYVQQSSAGFTGTQFGVSADKLVPADFDGDGKTDLAVYRNGTWYLNRSGAGFTGFSFGAPDDIPQPADFDGDGKADLAVWRPSNGTWYVYNLATGQFTSTQFGSLGDKPVSGDYNGDGKADYAVYRPSNGTWYIAKATGIASQNFDSIQFGDSQDKPVAADYDGDGKTDVAVFRPSNGVWYRLNSSTGQFAGMQFGVSTDLPVPADYDGDGKADLAVFRNGTWYLNRSTAGFTGVQFGASTDKPVPNAFVP